MRPDVKTTVRALGWALLTLLCACTSELEPTTQLLVTLSADPGVAAQLQLVKVSSYPLGSTDPTEPFAQQEFTLTQDLPFAKRATFPFSFGVARGQADALLLVVEGYASTDVSAVPVIERKLAVRFLAGQTTPLELALVEACYARASACTGLEQTCYPIAVGSRAAGACGPVGDAPPRAVGPSLDAGVLDGESPRDAADVDADARSADARGDRLLDGAPTDAISADTGADVTPAPVLDGCSFENVCRDPAYPCEPSTSSGYSCLGQVAEWPMPDGVPGSKFPPDLDATSVQDVVLDKVTGLIWQRTLPTSYTGCTGTIADTTDNGCTWAQAKAYCEQLPLDGKKWRLPSLLELASIIDERTGLPAIDRTAFPGVMTKNRFWTASPSTSGAGFAWVVGFGFGVININAFADVLHVRCVRSVVSRPGTPRDRYRIDAASDSITDTRTELTWQRTLSGANVDYEQAKAYCAGLGNGYRIPAYKELLTLLDPAAGNTPLDPRLPAVDEYSFFWTSSPAVFDKQGTWVVGLGTSGLTLGYESQREALLDIPAEIRPDFTYQAWCVR